MTNNVKSEARNSKRLPPARRTRCCDRKIDDRKTPALSHFSVINLFVPFRARCARVWRLVVRGSGGPRTHHDRRSPIMREPCIPQLASRIPKNWNRRQQRAQRRSHASLRTGLPTPHSLRAGLPTPAQDTTDGLPLPFVSFVSFCSNPRQSAAGDVCGHTFRRGQRPASNIPNPVSILPISHFGFVSHFEIRISDFPKRPVPQTPNPKP